MGEAGFDLRKQEILGIPESLLQPAVTPLDLVCALASTVASANLLYPLGLPVLSCPDTCTLLQPAFQGLHTEPGGISSYQSTLPQMCPSLFLSACIIPLLLGSPPLPGLYSTSFAAFQSQLQGYLPLTEACLQVLQDTLPLAQISIRAMEGCVV